MIGNLIGRIAMADKMSVGQLEEALQNKTLPAYIAIPLIEEKSSMAQRMQASQNQAPQAPIADEILQRAQMVQMNQGIDALPTNMPMQQAEGMAGGGIIAFSGGGDAEDEDDEDTKFDKETEELISRLIAARQAGMADQAGIAGLPSNLSAMGGLGTGVQAPSSAAAQMGIAPTSEAPSTGIKVPGHKYQDKIISEAERMGLDPKFALYIAGRETGGLKNPETAKSSAGALGIMQLMPGTAKDLGVKDPLDPDQNIAGGVRYAKMMMDKYGDPRLAAIAYNWGPGNTDKWLKSGADMSKLPKETRNYVASLKEGGAIRFQNEGLAVDPELQKRIEALGMQLDEARIAAKRAPSSRDLAKDPSLMDTYKSNVARRDELQRQYETLMETEGGLGGRAPLQLSPSGRKVVPVPNPITQQSVKSAPLPARQAATTSAAPIDYNAEIGEDPFGQRGMAAVEAMPSGLPDISAASGTPGAGGGQSLADKLEALIAQRESGLKSQREQDRGMALLAAGLGMMGGTSQHAIQNIGAGAMKGVEYARGAAKERGAEENAILAGRLKQQQLQQYGDIRRELASQGQEAKFTQQMSIAKKNMMDNIIRAKKIDINAMDQSQLSRIEAEAEAMLSRDPAYQAMYKRLYGVDFKPSPMGAPAVDYNKTYGLTPRAR